MSPTYPTLPHLPLLSIFLYNPLHNAQPKGKWTSTDLKLAEIGYLQWATMVGSSAWHSLITPPPPIVPYLCHPTLTHLPPLSIFSQQSPTQCQAKCGKKFSFKIGKDHDHLQCTTIGGFPASWNSLTIALPPQYAVTTPTLPHIPFLSRDGVPPAFCHTTQFPIWFQTFVKIYNSWPIDQKILHWLANMPTLLLSILTQQSSFQYQAKGGKIII